MKDQVDALQAKGIEATFVNSSLDCHERNRRYEHVARGMYSLLYVTPERFRKDGVRIRRTLVAEFRAILENPTAIVLTGADSFTKGFKGPTYSFPCKKFGAPTKDITIMYHSAGCR
jgi:hypothetical protein